MAQSAKWGLVARQFSTIVGAISAAIFGISALITVLQRDPRAELGEIKGILKDARAKHAAHQSDNSLDFHLEKHDQLFRAQGIGSANLQFFMAKEAEGHEVHVMVRKGDIDNPAVSVINVHQLKSPKNMYLKLNSRLKDQERWRSFSIFNFLGAFGLVIFLGIRLRRSLRTLQAQDPSEVIPFKSLDPLVVLSAQRPLEVGLAVGFAFLLIAFLLFQVKTALAISLISLSVGTLYGLLAKKKPTLLPWVSLVRDSHAAMIAAQPARIKTDAPKHMKAIQMLLDSGKIDIRDTQGRTPLQMACESGQVEVVDILLKNFANIDTQDNEGNSPLMAAVKSKRLGVVVKLLEMTPDLEMKNMAGDTALAIAEKNQTEGIVLVLKKAATERKKESLLK